MREEGVDSENVEMYVRDRKKKNEKDTSVGRTQGKDTQSEQRERNTIRRSE